MKSIILLFAIPINQSKLCRMNALGNSLQLLKTVFIICFIQGVVHSRIPHQECFRSPKESGDFSIKHSRWFNSIRYWSSPRLHLNGKKPMVSILYRVKATFAFGLSYVTNIKYQQVILVSNFCTRPAIWGKDKSVRLTSSAYFINLEKIKEKVNSSEIWTQNIQMNEIPLSILPEICVQRRYHRQWGKSEVLLLLAEDYSQYSLRKW